MQKIYNIFAPSKQQKSRFFFFPNIRLIDFIARFSYTFDVY